MHPILFQYGFITIHTYGFLIAIAFYFSISLSARAAEKKGIDPEKMMDLGMYILISAIVGARLLFVAINYESYINTPLDIFKIWEGGLVFYGGLLLVVPVGAWYLKKYSLPSLQCMDILAPYISLGHSIGRLGCFFAGCCYGSLSNVSWAVIFTDTHSLAPLNVSLHPTQIYSSVLNFTIFLILSWLYKRKTFDGQIFAFYLILYSIVRFIVENFRSDARGSLSIMRLELFTSQWISILILLSGFLMMGFTRKRSRKSILSK